MKRLFLIICLIVPVALQSQETTASTDMQPVTAKLTGSSDQVAAANPTPPAKVTTTDRMFFPKDWYWGWAQFDLAPPHNEVDPNLCAANAGQYGGANSQCNAFARYMISGVAEIRPFGRTQLRRLMVFFDPTFLFGKNVPQYSYTWSWSGIGMEYAWGVGIDLPKRFEFRYTGHPLIQRFGARNQPLGPAWLGPNGPWGRYNTIGVRKYFGTRREGTY